MTDEGMTGETDLEKLLSTMQPRLQTDVFVFVTLPSAESLPDSVEPLMVLREDEGWTGILEEAAAARVGLAGTFRCRMITLAVHSSLEAVGFLAAILPRMAAAGIGVNPVAGFHHDHLFVPVERAEEAMVVLRDLSSPRSPGENFGAAAR